MGRRPRDLTDVYDTAEENGSCVVTFSQGERQLLIRHARADNLVCPLPGLFVRNVTWEELNPNERALWAMRGLASLHHDWTFCSTSAALAYGLRVSYAASRTIHVIMARRRSKVDGAGLPPELHTDHSLSISFDYVDRALLSLHGTEEHDGLTVTRSSDTICGCLGDLDFSDGLVVADSYLNKFGTTRDVLLADLDTCLKCNDYRQARETARHADARAESGGESVARARMILNGYETPDLQVEFKSPLDGHLMRADFLWRHTSTGPCTIVGEFDGFEKYENPTMTGGRSVDKLLIRQNQRDTHLNLCSDAVFHFGPDDIRSDYRLCRILDTYRVPRST